jgi:hypothetical protein
MNDWSWSGEDGKSSTVVRSVQAVAVYTNPDGDIVIRQQGEFGGDDSVIIIPPQVALAVSKSIMTEAGE